MREKQAVTREYKPRYQKATKKEKGALLEEFLRLTGCHRKSAVRLLAARQPKQLMLYGKGRAVKIKPEKKRSSNRKGKRVYTDELIGCPRLAWTFFWYKWTFQALSDLKTSCLLPIREFHSDNGSRFINNATEIWRKHERLSFTRSRDHKKNDNLNFFMPIQKLTSKTRVGSKEIKVYDKPRGPFQRLSESREMSQKFKDALATHCALYNRVHYKHFYLRHLAKRKNAQG
jgi:hypothetical protein